MERVPSVTSMDLPTQDPGLMIRDKAMVSSDPKTVRYTQVSGLTIRSMVKELWFYLLVK
jgi:hypothetical protein